MLFVWKYDPLIHHRRSIRLRGYDYSSAGRYFITICCQGHFCRFAAIEDGKMILNDAGKMIEKWHLQLPNKFNDIKLGPFVVMPNHFHAIIINTGEPVRADQRVRPENIHLENVRHENMNSENVRPENIHLENVRPENMNSENVCPENMNSENVRPENMNSENVRPVNMNPVSRGEHVGSPLPHVVQWFKTMTTNEYIRGVKNMGWERFDGKLWQRNYYEHIIRDEKSYNAISKYIIDNPAKWMDDKFHIQ